MLVEFNFKNYRSFRDETTLSMEAGGLSNLKGILTEEGSYKLLPCVAVYGKNGGGKSNVIRAFWLAVQFIKNAQRTQHEKSEIPVQPFGLNDYSSSEPTEFEFVYYLDKVKYIYGFSANREKILKEYLYHSPKGEKSLVFSREEQTFSFTNNKTKRKLISEMVAKNQLFFSVACTMNDTACINAMRWFRDCVIFSRDYSDIPSQLLEYSEDEEMLKAISEYAKSADLGIEDMSYKFNNVELNKDMSFPENMPEGIKAALTQFIKSLSEVSSNADVRLKMGEVTATSTHRGINKDGAEESYPIDLSDESDGTRKLMSLAPSVESTLRSGGVLLVDELDRSLHPALVNYLVSKFQSKNTNTKGAQLIFTTHGTELLSMELIRKDQIYFVNKSNKDGASELYSIAEFMTRTTDNIRKGYLVGKYGAIPDIEIEEVE